MPLANEIWADGPSTSPYQPNKADIRAWGSGLDDFKDRFAVTGAAPAFACRAWVNFSGSGAVSMRGNGNVSSITDIGAGDYWVNFAVEMPDVNYACVFGATVNNTSSPVAVGENLAYSRSVSRVRVNVQNFAANDLIDWQVIQLAIFR